MKETPTCEDIVQEIFLHIWEKKQQLIGSGELRFYLYTAVRNNCYTHLQKNKKSLVTPLSGQETSIPLVEAAAKENKEKDFDSLMKEALEQLPPRCREVFVLSRVEKLTYQQIADRLNISAKTVENQIGKALKVLRNFVKKNRQNITVITLLFSLWTIK